MRITETSASIGVQKRKPMSKPAFLSELAPINLTEGDTLQTKLIISGDPTPFAKWYINEQVGVLAKNPIHIFIVGLCH